MGARIRYGLLLPALAPGDPDGRYAQQWANSVKEAEFYALPILQISEARALELHELADRVILPPYSLLSGETEDDPTPDAPTEDDPTPKEAPAEESRARPERVSLQPLSPTEQQKLRSFLLDRYHNDTGLCRETLQRAAKGDNVNQLTARLLREWIGRCSVLRRRGAFRRRFLRALADRRPDRQLLRAALACHEEGLGPELAGEVERQIREDMYAGRGGSVTRKQRALKVLLKGEERR